jgi:uncharacterized membrane protein SirB2
VGFLLIKTLHIVFVTGSYALFLMRGIWSMNGSSIMQTRWIRIVPHVIDTLLLISATALAVIIHQYPFVDAWLSAKVVGLLLYIVLGFAGLRGNMSKAIRIPAWLAAQAVFAYIVLVAITHKPFPC